MLLSNAPDKLVLPFASAGSKNAIPVDSQIGIVGGAASLADGFPPLTRTPVAAGGVPPSGLDMNGILFEMSNVIRWANAGGGYPFDQAFADDPNVDGYPKGARVLRADGSGYWFNTVDDNATDPESAGAAAAGWVPDYTNGAAAVTMTNANVTLTPAQYGKPVIIITGTITANLNLIFPTIQGSWIVRNDTTGDYVITLKTAAGTGVSLLRGSGDLIYGDGTNIKAASFTMYQQSGVGAAVRTAVDKMREHVSVSDFGAIGDNMYHPLSERFGSLALAQVVYPHAVHLTDSIDWAALQAAINTNKSVDLEDLRLCTNRKATIPATAAGSVYFGRGFHHYSQTKKTVVKALDRSLLPDPTVMASIFELANGADNITFRDVRVDADDQASMCVDASFGAFLSYDNVGVYNSLNYGHKGRQGLARIRRVFSAGHAEVGFEIYSDSAVEASEFTGGQKPLRCVAGGNRFTDVWVNSGSVCCLDLEPLDVSTSLINTSFKGLYIGETLGGESAVPIIRIQGNASQRVQDTQFSNLHIVCAAEPDKINIGILVDKADGITIDTPAILGNTGATATRHLKHFISATNMTNLSVTGGHVRYCTKNLIVLGTACYNSNICGVNFYDWATSVAAGTEGAAILVTDNTNYGSVKGCNFDISGASTVPYAMQGGDASRFVFDNFIRYGNAAVWTPTTGTFSGLYRRLGSTQVLDNVAVKNSTLDSTNVNNCKKNFQQRGTIAAGAGATTTNVLLLPVLAENQHYDISFMQDQNGANATFGQIFAYNATGGAITTGNTQSATLTNTITIVAGQIKFTQGSGYGATTWDWVITRRG